MASTFHWTAERVGHLEAGAPADLPGRSNTDDIRHVVSHEIKTVELKRIKRSNNACLETFLFLLSRAQAWDTQRSVWLQV